MRVSEPDIVLLCTDTKSVETSFQTIPRAYENGEGVAKDDVEAVKWYRKAAEQGDAYAQHNLGLAYSYGSGVVKDYVEAAASRSAARA